MSIGDITSVGFKASGPSVNTYGFQNCIIITFTIYASQQVVNRKRTTQGVRLLKFICQVLILMCADICIRVGTWG